MIHQPMGGAQGQATDIEITAREILKLGLNCTASSLIIPAIPLKKWKRILIVITG